MNSAITTIVQYRWNLVAPAQQAAMLYAMAAAALVFNLFDAILTMIWVKTGIAIEANPLMEPILSASPVGFVLAKTALVSLGLLLLWRLRSRVTAALAIVATALLYCGIVAYHVKGLLG